MKQTKDTFKENVITRRIGSTTYKVRVEFCENATETMEEKILRMVKNESLTNGNECDIIESPQMSRQSERSAV